MLWYGQNSINYNKLNKNYLYFKINLRYSIHNLKYTLDYKFNKNLFKINLIIPNNWYFIKFIKLNTNINYLFLFNNLYYFYIFNISKNKVVYLNLLDIISFEIKYFNIYFKNYWKEVNKIFLSFNKIFYKRIKFQGKTYRLYKSWRNTIVYQFGYSHRIYLYCYLFSLKFLSKFSILLFGINWKIINFKAYKLIKWKYLNIFTGRGLRFSKQIIYKKEGKVSSYH